ncbi:MAG TPA: hypothetical protein PLS50_09030, partial [Candidatus Dojkabacteria bacterium]|nr:hypothetical protein [Candidatus Dojkabacteria bacterium]
NPNNVPVNINCIIIENFQSQYDVIFGLPAISQLKIIIKIDEGLLSIQDYTHKLLTNHYNKTSEIRTCNKIVIPSGKEL